MVVCTDISRIKEIEKEGSKLRSQFFSSVAHELRTPLNSMIPILKLVLEMLASNRKLSNERLEEYLQIVYNSSIHLESVIDDALDITRLENNNFKIYKELFNIRKVLKEIEDIMKFQVKQKGL